jgi:hypothetical protein
MSLRSEVIAAIGGVAGLSGKVFSGAVGGAESVVPTGVTAPYAHLNEFGRAPNLAGDSRTLATRRQFQVSIWQYFDDETDVLIDQVISAVDGLKITEPGYLHCIFEFSFRIEEREAGLAQHALTFSVTQAV